MTAPQQPTWLAEPCPTWCARAHEEADHPEDRFHQSSVALIAVVAGPRSVPPNALLRPTELSVRLGRYAGQTQTWVTLAPIEGTTPALVLTAESGRTVAEAIQGVLSQAD